QDAHGICPACRHGQEALERMMRMEATKLRRPRDGDAEEQEPQHRGAMTPDDYRRREEAHEFYLLGERCRRAGDGRMAFGFYEESHHASPDSYYGHKALERMQLLERRRRLPDGAEEGDVERGNAGEYRAFPRWNSPPH